MSNQLTSLKKALRSLVNILRTKFKGKLCALVLFGSVARDKYTAPTSDIDLLLVYRGGNYRALWREARQEWEEKYLESLRKNNMPTFLSPIFLKEKELEENPLILLDIIDEGIILFDEGDLLKHRLKLMRERLKEVGAKKVYIDNNRWYWDLKPDWRPGERFSL
jgi:predicted nucleotidyltransferase